MDFRAADTHSAKTKPRAGAQLMRPAGELRRINQWSLASKAKELGGEFYRFEITPASKRGIHADPRLGFELANCDGMLGANQVQLHLASAARIEVKKLAHDFINYYYIVRK